MLLLTVYLSVETPSRASSPTTSAHSPSRAHHERPSRDPSPFVPLGRSFSAHPPTPEMSAPTFRHSGQNVVQYPETVPHVAPSQAPFDSIDSMPLVHPDHWMPAPWVDHSLSDHELGLQPDFDWNVPYGNPHAFDHTIPYYHHDISNMPDHDLNMNSVDPDPSHYDPSLLSRQNHQYDNSGSNGHGQSDTISRLLDYLLT